MKTLNNKYLSFDKSLHLTLARFNSSENKRNKTFQHLVNLLKNNWLNEGYASFEEEARFKDTAITILTNYYNNPRDVGIENVLLDKTLLSKFSNETVLISKIDKLVESDTGVFELIDYKTGKCIPNKTDLFDALKVSKLLYIINNNLGIYPDLISYYYLRKNQKFSLKINDELIKKCNRYLCSTFKNL